MKKYIMVLITAAAVILSAFITIPEKTNAICGESADEPSGSGISAAEEEIIIIDRKALTINGYKHQIKRKATPERITKANRRRDSEQEAGEEVQGKAFERDRDGTGAGEDGYAESDTGYNEQITGCGGGIHPEDEGSAAGNIGQVNPGGTAITGEAVNEPETGEKVQEVISEPELTPEHTENEERDEDHQGSDDCEGDPAADPGTAELTIRDQLRIALENAGIGYFWPYAWAQAQQESRWNPYAENANGLDKGLFQYRITYWTQPESIFDTNAQIRLYVSQVQTRLAAGLSIEETISRHYTSDYVTTINWQYVNDVLQWLR